MSHLCIPNPALDVCYFLEQQDCCDHVFPQSLWTDVPQDNWIVRNPRSAVGMRLEGSSSRSSGHWGENAHSKAIYPRHMHWQMWKAVSLPGLLLMPADLLEWAFPPLPPPKWKGQTHLDLSTASLPLLVLVWLYFITFNVIVNNTREIYLVSKQTYTIPCTVQTVLWTLNQTRFSFPIICLPVSVQQLRSSTSAGKTKHS